MLKILAYVIYVGFYRSGHICMLVQTMRVFTEMVTNLRKWNALKYSHQYTIDSKTNQYILPLYCMMSATLYLG